jgi:hypothetical protein
MAATDYECETTLEHSVGRDRVGSATFIPGSNSR